jgi:hypothetical protein
VGERRLGGVKRNPTVGFRETGKMPVLRGNKSDRYLTFGTSETRFFGKTGFLAFSKVFRSLLLTHPRETGNMRKTRFLKSPVEFFQES